MSVLLQKPIKSASIFIKLNNLHWFSKLIGSMKPIELMLIMESPPCNCSTRNVKSPLHIFDIKYFDELSSSHLKSQHFSLKLTSETNTVWYLKKPSKLIRTKEKKNLGMYGTNVQEGWTKRSFLPDCHYCIIADCGVLRLGLKINYT